MGDRGDREEVEQCRDQRHDHDLGVGHPDHLGHDEHRGPLVRRHEHAPGRGCGRDGAGDVGAVAGLLHQRNGEGAGRDRVRHRTARDHPQHAAGQHRCLRRPGAIPCRECIGQPDEEGAGAERVHQRAEDDEEQHVRSHHLQHEAEHPLLAVEVGGDAPKPVAAVRDVLGQQVAPACIGQEQDGDDRQHQPHHPPRRLDRDDDGERGHVEVHRQVVADPLHQSVEGDGEVAERDDRREYPDAVDERRPVLPGRPVRRVEQEDQDAGQKRKEPAVPADRHPAEDRRRGAVEVDRCEGDRDGAEDPAEGASQVAFLDRDRLRHQSSQAGGHVTSSARGGAGTPPVWPIASSARGSRRPAGASTRPRPDAAGRRAGRAIRYRDDSWVGNSRSRCCAASSENASSMNSATISSGTSWCTIHCTP